MTPELEQVVRSVTDAVADGSVTQLGQARAFLVDRGLHETDAEAVLHSLADYLNSKIEMPPITKIEINVTEDCNLNCDYCFVRDKKARGMSQATAMSAVDFLLEHSGDESEISILMFGGEPLLEFDLIKDIVTHAEARCEAADKKPFFNLTTNGTLLNEERLAFFRDHGVKFLLSLDGSGASHDKHRKARNGKGTLDAIVAKIPLIKRYQAWLGAKMTIMPDTVDQLGENIRYLHEVGIHQFLFGPADGTEWSDDDLRIYRQELEKVIAYYRDQTVRKIPIRINLIQDIDSGRFFDKSTVWGCRAGRQSLSIAVNGDIHPCSKMAADPELRAVCRLGNLDEGISDPILRMRLIGALPIERVDCADCGSASSCAGGCFAVNFAETGSMFRPDAAGECRFAALSAELARTRAARPTS